MKDKHLTVRIPADLARALARWAQERGVPKSQVAREAVVRYLAPATLQRVPPFTAGDLLDLWPSLPRLTAEEAEAFAEDIAAGRRELPPVRDAWE